MDRRAAIDSITLIDSPPRIHLTCVPAVLFCRDLDLRMTSVDNSEALASPEAVVKAMPPHDSVLRWLTLQSDMAHLSPAQSNRFK